MQLAMQRKAYTLLLPLLIFTMQYNRERESKNNKCLIINNDQIQIDIFEMLK